MAKRCGPHAIVYPHLASLARYQWSRTPRDSCVDECLRPCVPNRFVAVVPRAQARDIAEALSHAVSERWTRMACKVRTWLGDDAGGFDAFDEQVSEHPVVDIVAQRWPTEIDALRSMLADAGLEPKPDSVPYDNVGEGYADVFRLGRTTLGALRRVIPPAPSHGDARAKCTQCGLREAMGPQPGRGRRHAQRQWWSKLRVRVDGAGGGNTSGQQESTEATESKETVDLRSSEMLCAVCLTKRFAHRCALAKEFGLDWSRPDQRVKLRFPSVASVASAPFRSRLAKGDHRPGRRCVDQWHPRWSTPISC